MRLAIGMTHAYREKCFTSWTMESLRNEGLLAYPMLVKAEPGAQRFMGMSYTAYIENENKLGCFNNFFSLITLMLDTYYANPKDRDQDSKSWLLLLEDDIELQPGAGDAFRKMINLCDTNSDSRKSPYSTVGFFSLYTSAVNYNPMPGWHKAAISKFGWCGNLALCLRVDCARRILRNHHVTDPLPLYRRASDHQLGLAVLDEGYSIWCHNPNMVTHLGSDTSTLMSPEHRNFNHPVRTAYMEANAKCLYPSAN